MTSNIRVAILITVLIALLPLSNSSARYNNNFYLQQQSYRQSQMLQQQQMRQQQMLQQQRMRQQQDQMRRQQEQARRQQEQMRRQMQERQRQAQLQRQRTAERQRQLQQQRQKNAQEKQRTQAQRQQLAKQQNALQQQRSLREQRKTRLRQDRLRRLQNDRLKKRKANKKKQGERTTLTLATLLKRNSSSATLAKPVTRIAQKSQTPKQFQDRRQQQRKKLRVTKQFDKQRKTIQARAQKAKALKNRLIKTNLQKKKTAQNAKATQKKAEKAFGVCRGKGCGNKSCSFHGDTGVLTKDGLKPIREIVAGTDFVWSQSELTGHSDWKQVIDQYVNDYEETVSLRVGIEERNTIQTILSNRIHPFFVVDEGVHPNAHNVAGGMNTSAISGRWVEAGNLAAGDKLYTRDAQLAEVVGNSVEDTPLRAFNITVAEYHTFFIAGERGQKHSSVWVHNDCDTDKGLEKLSKAEAKLLKISEKGPDGTRVAREGVGKKAKVHVFKKDPQGIWLRTRTRTVDAKSGHKGTALIAKQGSFKQLDKAHGKEVAFGKELAARGYNVIVRGKGAAGADLVVNGKQFELKTLEANTINAVRKNIREGIKQGDGRVFIDGRKAGLSHATAIRAVQQHVAAGRMGKAIDIRILSKSGEYRWEP